MSPQDMVSATLSVVQHKAIGGGCGHWAFHLLVKDGDKKTDYILQIVNKDSPSFRYEELEGVDPQASSKFIRPLLVIDSINGQENINSVKAIIAKQEIKEVAQWSCQDWVLEALESLNLEQELDDFTYGELKDTLEDDYQHF